uniref:Uncharacterized protein n=1 Tax=Lepeophtheirus salmonis TaxID=72036 RepID=A0A0K2T4I7_LEPSM
MGLKKLPWTIFFHSTGFSLAFLEPLLLSNVLGMLTA